MEILDIIKRHESLYIKTLRQYDSAEKTENYRYIIQPGLLEEIDRLITQDMRDVFSNEQLHLEEYMYLANAIKHWNAAFNFCSKKKKDNYTIPSLGKYYLPGGIPNPLAIPIPIDCSNHKYTEQDLEKMLMVHTSHLNNPYLASVYLAYYVLEDIIPLRTKLGSDSFWRLENIWLKNVKELIAWLVWKREGEIAEDWRKEKDYFIACWIIRSMLLNPEKGNRQQFGTIKKYLIKNYLKEVPTKLAGHRHKSYIIDESKAKTHELIRRKAQRIWELGGTGSKENDWANAQNYVNLFYDNIIAAVEENDEESIENVLLAFQFSKSPNNRFLIINCFETAVALNFLKTSKLINIFDRKELTVEEIL